MFTTFSALPAHLRTHVGAVAEWIKANIPCPVGGYASTPSESLNRVSEELRRQAVPVTVGVAAMTAVFGPRVFAAKAPAWNQGPKIGPASADARLGNPATLAMWEHHFTIAQLNNDLDTANDILQAILELLYYAAGGKREEFERVTRDLRAHARTAYGSVQHLTAEELRRLRESPTPSDFSRLRVNVRRGQQARGTRQRGR